MNVLPFVFIGMIVIGIAWYWIQYARTPANERGGGGRLAPAQQKVWARFCYAMVAVAFVGLAISIFT